MRERREAAGSAKLTRTVNGCHHFKAENEAPKRSF